MQRAMAYEVYGRSLLIQIHVTTSELPRILFGKIAQEVPLDVLPDPPNLLAWRDAAASASALVRQRGQRSPSLLKESTTEDPLRAGTLSDMPNRFRELIQNLSVWSTQ